MTVSLTHASCQCVKDDLNHGNMEFVESLRREQVLASPENVSQQKTIIQQVGRVGDIPQQTPTTAVLACSDARVSVLHLFQKQPNEIFEIRLAGNVASKEGLGSLLYAVEHLPSVEGIAVLGHTGCGAVTATVDYFLSNAPRTDEDNPIYSLIKHILFSVDVSAAAMAMTSLGSRADSSHALDRQKLIDVAVFVNAAATAWKVQNYVQDASRKVPVWYGIYDLATCRVMHPNLDDHRGDLLLGLGPSPTAVGINEVAKVLVNHLEQAQQQGEEKFTPQMR